MTTYKDAGVDIEAGDAFVERISPYAARTRRPEVISGVGGFAGLFALPPGRFKEPVLVAGTDGVGTKLKLAFLANKHDTVGIDLVAMSVNDVITTGAEPLFFLDYFATSRLEVDDAAQVVKGIAEGCEDAGCTLLGGETAELPGFYARGEYDLAGFCVGVVERKEILDGKKVAEGDVVVGLASSGLHSNGYSLARKVLMPDGNLPKDPALVEALLAPTRIYVKAVKALRGAAQVKALSHITGSGLPGNVPRVLPKGTRAILREGSWTVPALFERIEREGNVARAEMYNTFNMGLGLVAVVPKEDAQKAVDAARSCGIDAWEVGVIEAGEASQEAEALIR